MMTLYARVQNGLVEELLNWSSDNPPIAECFHADIGTWVGTTGHDPKVGWSWNGTVFAAPSVPALTTAQEFAKRLSAGLALTSTAAPSLNATYAVDDDAQRNLIALYTSVKGGDGLPGGGTTFFYRDIAGAPHAFAAGDITALAKAVRDYVYALGLAAAEPVPVWPSATATIP